MKEKSLTFMEWSECEKRHLRNIEIDKEKIKAILSLAEKRVTFVTSLNVTEASVSFIVENYYEIIKELLIALLLKKGMRSDNHQCLITYFYKNYPQHEGEAHLILQLSYLRNRLEYYGESIDIDFYKKHEKEFLKIIEMIKKLVETKQ